MTYRCKDCREVFDTLGECRGHLMAVHAVEIRDSRHHIERCAKGALPEDVALPFPT